ncbi:MAG: asparagine synthase-related protein [Planctomycetota bacterium]
MSFLIGQFHFDGRACDMIRMNAVLEQNARYGPDGRGTWSDGSMALGHLMHFSTPESVAESLPSTTRNGRFAITGDTRIDYRDELARQLDVSTVGLCGMPDSQLILRAWVKWGEKCVERLDGDFAFSVFDVERRELHCVQSAFVLTPIYWVKTETCFTFASRIQSLLTLTGLPRRLNERYFGKTVSCASLTDRNGPSEDDNVTMFDGVRTVPAASVMTVLHDGSIRSRIWWKPDPDHEIRLTAETDYYDRIRELMLRSVHDRMRSHRPVASHLSGGLDSSSITCIAARRLREQGQPLTAISSVLPKDYDGPHQDEREFINIVREAEDLEMAWIWPSETMADDVSLWMNYLEQPVLNHKQYVYAAFAQAAVDRGIGTILDGCMGEMGPSNHGNAVYPWMLRTGRWRTLLSELRALQRYDPRPLRRLILGCAIKPHVPAVGLWWNRIHNGASRQLGVELPLQREFARQHGLSLHYDENVVRTQLLNLVHPRHRLSESIAWLQRQSDCGTESLAMGVRTWYPFLDRRLLDFCLATPPRLHLANGWKRSLIRQAMGGILPPPIRWRTCKRAFSPDFYQRYQQSWPKIRDEVAGFSSNDLVRQVFDVPAVLQTIDRLANQPGDEVSPEGYTIKLAVLNPLSGMRFLHWFATT